MPKNKSYSSKRGKPQPKSNKLPLILVISGAIVLLIAAFFAVQKKDPYMPEVTGGPGIQVDKEMVDLGDMILGNTAQVSFTIKNVGDKTLRFSEAPYIEVKEGC
jgi:hypothetical protein